MITKMGQRAMKRVERRLQRDTRKFPEVMKIFYILIRVLVIWVYIFVKTHWNIHRKNSVNVIVCELHKLYLNKADWLKKQLFSPGHLLSWYRRQNHIILELHLEAVLISNPMIFKLSADYRLGEHNLNL